jgi:maltose-binding protein MalE
VKAANPEAFKDLGLFRLPDCNWKGKKWQPTVNIGWHVYVMPAGAKNKQAAAEWLKVLGSDEGQMLSYEVAGNEVAKLSVINKLPADSLQRQSATFNQFYRIVPPNTNPRKQEIWNGIAPLFQKMWLGQTSVKDTMEACQREVKRIMEKA